MTQRSIKFRQPVFIDNKFHHFHYWGYLEDGFVGPIADNINVQGGGSEQFTGLYDKNDREIYEGDILIIFDYFYQVKMVVTETKSFVDYGYPDKHNGSCNNWAEVIGNIYETPELVKQ